MVDEAAARNLASAIRPLVQQQFDAYVRAETAWNRTQVQREAAKEALYQLWRKSTPGLTGSEESIRDQFPLNSGDEAAIEALKKKHPEAFAAYQTASERWGREDAIRKAAGNTLAEAIDTEAAPRGFPMEVPDSQRKMDKTTGAYMHEETVGFRAKTLIQEEAQRFVDSAIKAGPTPTLSETLTTPGSLHIPFSKEDLRDLGVPSRR